MQAHGPLPETPAAMNERQLNTVENQYIRSQGMGSYHDQDYLRIAREHVAPAFAAAKENPATALASEASRGRIY